MRSPRVSVACLAVLLATAGCGGQASVNQSTALSCETRLPATHPADTLTVVVFDKIDTSHAPWPRNSSERFVFSHLYETLVNVDCHNQVRRGIAKSWKEASDGLYIEIQEDAHFWDDTPVTAADIQSSFAPAIRNGVIASVDIVDATHAIIHGNGRIPDLRLLAQPFMAIRKESSASGVAIGSGSWRIDPEVAADTVTICPANSLFPMVRFIQKDARDGKDYLDGSADALITDDPDVIDYARTKPELMLASLPWDAVYAVLSLSRLTTYIDECRLIPHLPIDVCDKLALDAVHMDAKGYSGLFVESRKAVSRVPDTVRDVRLPHITTESRIVYDRSDATARALAERLVALAANDPATSSDARSVAEAFPGIDKKKPRATGLTESEMSERLHNPSDFAYVLRFSWSADYPTVAQELYERSPWAFDPYFPITDLMVPLIETRPHLIAIRERVGVVADGHDARILAPGVERVQ